MRFFRSIACTSRRDDLRAAGFGYLAAGAAFLGLAFLAGQDTFTGGGFAFVGLGLAFIARAPRRPDGDNLR
jgi:hypothetical protein